MSSGHGSVISGLPRVGTAALVAKLDAERRSALEQDAGARLALAFDADGTLWSGDVGFDLFKAALAERALRPQARAALAEEAHAAGLSVAEEDDANAIAFRLFAAWAAGDYDDGRAFRMMAWAFAGHAEREVVALAERALETAGLRTRIHEPVLETIAWAHEAGVEVWIVSASPRGAVLVGGRLFGVEPAQVLAVTPRRSGELLLAELEEPVPYDVGKPQALAAAAPDRVILGAFGDSASDAPLLRGARVAVAVEPHAALRGLGPSLPHLVELVIEDAPHRPAPKP